MDNEDFVTTVFFVPVVLAGVVDPRRPAWMRLCSAIVGAYLLGTAGRRLQPGTNPFLP